MNRTLLSISLALAGSGALAAAAPAATDVHAVAGLGTVRVSDEDVAGKVTFRITPTADAASILFVDQDRDGRSDAALSVTRHNGALSLTARRTTASDTICQQLAGVGATALRGDEAGVAPALGGAYTITLAESVAGDAFSWLATSVAAYTEDKVCGPTDGSLAGFATPMSAGHVFTGGVVAPVDADPAAPTGLVAVAGDGAVDLDWADNAEADLAGYVVYRAVDGGAPVAIATTASALKDTGLTNGKSHVYHVRAKDAAGHLSAVSASVAALPVAPVIVPVPQPEVTPVPQPPVPAPVKPTPPAPAPAPAPAPSPAPAKPETPKVTQPGGAPDWVVGGKPAAAPAKPAVENRTPTTVTIEVPKKAKGVVKFNVYRRVKGGAWSTKPVGAAKGAAFTDKKLAPGRKYEYVLVAVNKQGKESAASKPVAVETKKAPRKPSKKPRA